MAANTGLTQNQRMTGNHPDAQLIGSSLRLAGGSGGSVSLAQTNPPTHRDGTDLCQSEIQRCLSFVVAEIGIGIDDMVIDYSI